MKLSRGPVHVVPCFLPIQHSFTESAKPRATALRKFTSTQTANLSVGLPEVRFYETLADGFTINAGAHAIRENLGAGHRVEI